MELSKELDRSIRYQHLKLFFDRCESVDDFKAYLEFSEMIFKDEDIKDETKHVK